MNTKVVKVDSSNINTEVISEAADIILAGGLVVFPTETVYGLGANTFNVDAVRGIFTAKGRPADNPLIVHISSLGQIEDMSVYVDDKTKKLLDAFWPGPLTVILKKSAIIPYEITAGLETVAIRMPSHPVALDLINKSGVPIAAPSANISGRPSTTSAKYVVEDLFGKVDLIIDSGDTEVGLESTVLDMSSPTPVILRPGGITKEQIEAVIGKIDVDKGILEYNKYIPKSPGQKYKHYSPKAQMHIICGNLDNVVEKIRLLASEYMKSNLKVGIMATEQTKDKYTKGHVLCVGDRDKPYTIASSLFKILREFDEAGVDLILAEAVDTNGVGAAIMNRMEKAAGYKIVKA